MCELELELQHLMADIDDFLIFYYMYYGISKRISKNGGKDQESIQSSTTPDPGYHMGK